MGFRLMTEVFMFKLSESTELTIEQPTLADVEVIAELRTSYWEETRAAHGGHQIRRDWVVKEERKSAGELLIRSDRYVRLAKDGARVLGMVTGTTNRSHLGCAELAFLAVDPTGRTRGIGHQLVEGYLASIPENFDVLVYPYGPDTERLQGFYGQLGFEPWQRDDEFMIRKGVRHA